MDTIINIDFDWIYNCFFVAYVVVPIIGILICAYMYFNRIPPPRVGERSRHVQLRSDAAHEFQSGIR